MGGTSQGNVFSGNVCRDVSYLIFKEIEKIELGVKIKLTVNSKEYEHVVIAFVDNSEFIVSGYDSEE